MSATETPPPRRTSTVLLAAASLVAALLAGIIIGVAGHRFLIMRAGPLRMPHRAPEFLVRRLDRHLDLTAEQEAEIKRILARSHTRIETVWSDVRPQVRQEIDRTNAEIERILTPEQREKFQDLKMRMAPMHGPGRGGGRRRGPPPFE